jgi:hypothetical protein
MIASGCLRVVAVLPLMFTLAGCCSGLPPATDVSQAQAALTAALDTWKQGQAPEKLRERTPPIDFRDMHQDQGCKLTSYEVQKAEVSGVSAKFTVKLQLTEKSGTSHTRIAVYSADTGQTIIIRPDSLGLD